MKIYVSHSRNFNFKEELYSVLEDSGLKHQFIFPHGNSNKPFNTKELLENKKCDLVLAEVSFSSTGQGIELGWANLLEIPIVCMYKNNSKISGSLGVVCNDFIEYENRDNLIKKLKENFKNYD